MGVVDSKANAIWSSWSAAQKLLIGNRPYIRIGQNGTNRVDLICTDGHPGETTTSVWHFYYSAGTFHKSDGTALGAPPFDVADLTKVYHGSVVTSWVWDVRHDAQGRPVAVYATFPNAPTDHRYCYARWNGAAWVNGEICAAGGTLYPIGDEAQPYYSGGICLDPDDVSVVYCSIETGTDGPHRNGGTFQIWRGATREGGETWDMSQLLKVDDDCFRPFKPPGSNKILFVQGLYTSYTSYETKITSLAVG
ncbi:hypothetical protein BH10PSE11_BH10PSE11_06160 [soil metagenome]